MNSSSFVKDFFFKKDENNELAIDITKTVLVLFAIAFIVSFLFYDGFYFDYFEYSILLGITVGIIVLFPMYILNRFYGQTKMFSELDEGSVKTLAILTFIVLSIAFILFTVYMGEFYRNPAVNIVCPVIVAAISAVFVYFVGKKRLDVEPLQEKYMQRKNHYLAFVVGFIFAFFIPVVGIAIGIYIYTRRDNEFSKVYGIFIIGLNIVLTLIMTLLSSVVSPF